MRLAAAIIGTATAFSTVPKTADDGQKPVADNRIAYSYEVNEDGKTATLTRAILPIGLKMVFVPEVIANYQITAIGARAYAGNFNLERVVVKSNVKSIGEKAFMSCTELKEVTLNEGIEKIPEDCFFSCPKLVSVQLPDTLTSIGDDAFYGCVALDIEIPAGVTSIGKNAVGMEAVSHSEGSTAIRGFLIKGKTGSAAESYALENGIDFIDLNNYLAGDVNGDSSISSTDASTILAEYALVSTGGASTLTKKQSILADINGDGLINSSDASVVLEIYAKNSTGG